MSYTFSIRKDKYEPLLEISIKEEIVEDDIVIHSYLEKCFERIFQLIREKIIEKQQLEGEDTEIEKEEEEEIVDTKNKDGFLSIFN